MDPHRKLAVLYGFLGACEGILCEDIPTPPERAVERLRERMAQCLAMLANIDAEDKAERLSETHNKEAA